MEDKKHPDAITYTNDSIDENHQAEKPKKSFLKKTRHKAAKTFTISKDIIILILSGVFVSLIIANIVVFVIPRGKAAPTPIPTPIPSQSGVQTPSVSPVVSQPVSLPPTRVPSATLTPTKMPTPSPTSLPTPTRAQIYTDATYGQLESVSCQTITGWAYDPNVASEPIAVYIYADGGTYGGFEIGEVTTSILRSDINSSKSITGNHGFSLPLTSSLKDGKEHSIYAYAEGVNGVRYQLSNTPTYITCFP